MSPKLISVSFEFREDDGGQDMRVTVSGLPKGYPIQDMADCVAWAVTARLKATGNIVGVSEVESNGMH